jgi:hypothetical protein
VLDECEGKDLPPPPPVFRKEVIVARNARAAGPVRLRPHVPPLSRSIGRTPVLKYSPEKPAILPDPVPPVPDRAGDSKDADVTDADVRIATEI